MYDYIIIHYSVLASPKSINVILPPKKKKKVRATQELESMIMVADRQNQQSCSENMQLLRQSTTNHQHKIIRIR